MKVLVCGGTGMLGSEVVLAAGNAGHAVRGFDRIELDVTDAERLIDKIGLERPDAVVNCAGMGDVDEAEANPDLAMELNATAAGNVARAAAEADAKVVYVSSAYIFDGSKGAPYVESDLPAPLSAYGRSKLAGEEATMLANPRAHVVRTSWIYGINGPNFVDSMLRYGRQEGRVLVIRDQYGSPTWTWHLAYGITRLLDSNEFGVHHMAADGYCSFYDFAREMFELARMEVVTLSASADMLGRVAPRPAFAGLTTEEPDAILLPAWQDGLTGYLAQRLERDAKQES